MQSPRESGAAPAVRCPTLVRSPSERSWAQPPHPVPSACSLSDRPGASNKARWVQHSHRESVGISTKQHQPPFPWLATLTVTFLPYHCISIPLMKDQGPQILSNLSLCPFCLPSVDFLSSLGLTSPWTMLVYLSHASHMSHCAHPFSSQLCLGFSAARL